MNAQDLVKFHGELAVEWAKDEDNPTLAAKHCAYHASAARLCAVLGARSAALQKIEDAHAKAHEGFLSEEEACVEIGHALEELREKIGERGEAKRLAASWGACAVCGHAKTEHVGALGCRKAVRSQTPAFWRHCGCEAFVVVASEDRGEPIAFDPTEGGHG